MIEVDVSRVSDADLEVLARFWAKLTAESVGRWSRSHPLGAFVYELAIDLTGELDGRRAALDAIERNVVGVGSLVEPGADPFAEAAAEFERAVREDEGGGAV